MFIYFLHRAIYIYNKTLKKLSQATTHQTGRFAHKLPLFFFKDCIYFLPKDMGSKTWVQSGRGSGASRPSVTHPMSSLRIPKPVQPSCDGQGDQGHELCIVQVTGRGVNPGPGAECLM